MAIPQPLKRFAIEEYLRLEEQASYKSDFYDGAIFNMLGGTDRHSTITMNVCGELRQLLKGKPCRPFESNMRLRIVATGLRTYPDASVYCEKIKFDPEDKSQTTLVNPAVVFEVLSPSTEAYDRGFKAENYRKVDSLAAYVLISQEQPHIEVYARNESNSWVLSEVAGLESAIAIPAIAITLKLAEVYDRVDFTPEAAVS